MLNLFTTWLGFSLLQECYDLRARMLTVWSPWQVLLITVYVGLTGHIYLPQLVELKKSNGVKHRKLLSTEPP